jgi:hypothetical protein
MRADWKVMYSPNAMSVYPVEAFDSLEERPTIMFALVWFTENWIPVTPSSAGEKAWVL